MKKNTGNINKISLQIAKTEQKDNTINKIEINISNKTETNKTITNEEYQEIIEYLKTNYGTEDIVINE